MFKLRIDKREQSIVDFFKGLSYVDVSVLPLGDIIFKWKGEILLIIERKTVDDFAASIGDGRFREQKMRLMSNYPPNKIMYLIEGNLNLPMNTEIRTNITVKTLYSSIYNMVIRDRIHVYKTVNISETLRFIKNLVWKLQKQGVSFMKNYTKEDYHKANLKMKLGKKKDMDKTTCFMYQLCQVKGVSISVAKAITNQYPSWVKLYEALQKYTNDLDKFSLIASITLPTKSMTDLEVDTKTNKIVSKNKIGSKNKIVSKNKIGSKNKIVGKDGRQRKPRNASTVRKVGNAIACRICHFMFT